MGIFSKLPVHNQKEVLKKLNFEEFSKFKQCSQETVEIANDINHPLSQVIPGITFFEDTCLLHIKPPAKTELESIVDEPIRIVGNDFVLQQPLSHENFAYLAGIFRKTNLTAKMLNLSRLYGENDSASVDSLLVLLKAEMLNIGNYPSSFLSELKEIRKLKKVAFYFSEMEEEDFLLLENEEIAMISQDTVEVEGFLKQWMDGKRRIKEVSVTPLPDEELDYPILWSPESHESSPFAHLEIITGGYGEELMKLYSLEREDGKKLYIAMMEIMATQMIAREYEDIKEIEDWIIKNFTPDTIPKQNVNFH